jgi:hypothetical protein
MAASGGLRQPLHSGNEHVTNGFPVGMVGCVRLMGGGWGGGFNRRVDAMQALAMASVVRCCRDPRDSGMDLAHA